MSKTRQQLAEEYYESNRHKSDDSLFPIKTYLAGWEEAERHFLVPVENESLPVEKEQETWEAVSKFETEMVDHLIKYLRPKSSVDVFTWLEIVNAIFRHRKTTKP